MGLCSPGVSTKTICRLPSVRIPRRRLRVVWGRGLMGATFTPRRLLSRVDLPTLGLPTMATNPE